MTRRNSTEFRRFRLLRPQYLAEFSFQPAKRRQQGGRRRQFVRPLVGKVFRVLARVEHSAPLRAEFPVHQGRLGQFASQAPVGVFHWFVWRVLGFNVAANAHSGRQLFGRQPLAPRSSGSSFATQR